MNINYIKLWAIALIALFALNIACSDDVDPMIIIPTDSTEVKFDRGEFTHTVKFNSNQAWSVSILDAQSEEVSWLDVSPKSGEAGEVVLTLTADESYMTQSRAAYLHINIDGLSESIEITQEPGVLVFLNDKPTDLISPKGFYVVNEDWFGWDEGTVNYFEQSGNDLTASYRVFRGANENETLGATSTYGEVWGDNIYFVSKQGVRLVVADAKTLKQKASFGMLNGIGDGRGFVGYDDKKAYASGLLGLASFDIENLKMGDQIEGVSGQIGNMGVSAGRLFAVSNNTLYVIDAETDEIEETFAGSYNTLTVSKDGDVWVAAANKLIRVNPVTLEQEEMDYPGGATINGSWGAWNANGLTASTQSNVLYWTTGGGMFGGAKKVVKYDIETEDVNADFFVLGESSYGKQMEFYGAGVRVNPLTDELVLVVKHSGWGDAGAYNWVLVVDNNGNQKSIIELQGDSGQAAGWADNADDWNDKYFWFQSMPVFEDVNKPQILLNQVLLTANEKKVIDLNDLIIDYDNTFMSMIKSVETEENDVAIVTIEGDDLIIEANENYGTTVCTLSVVSNGVRVDKNVEITIIEE